MVAFSSKPRVYATACDIWLLAVAAAVPFLCTFAGLLMVGGTEQELAGWIIMGIGVALGLYLICSTFPINYSFGENALVIRAGLAGGRSIPYTAITAVTPCREPDLSPAWSFARLRIDYHDQGELAGFVLISPQEREAFCRELEENCYHLELFADGLTLRERKVDANGKPRPREAAAQRAKTIHGLRVDEDEFHQSRRR